MRTRYSVFLVFLIVQIICLGNPKIWAEEGDLAETKSKQETQRIIKLRIEIKSEKEEKILKAMGLECEWGENQTVCNATISQMDQLKQAGIEFQVVTEGIRIEKKRSDYEGEKNDKGVVSGQNGNNYSIPYQNWTYSPITIASAPAQATVASIDVRFKVIHTYVGDLAIDLTDEDLGHEYRLWNYQGGSQDNIDTTIYGIIFFNGELVNQTWKLWAWDCCVGDTGYIDYWWIQIWYTEPDLIVQSLTASNYNPNVGDYIDVTMVIKNQGNGPAYGWFYNGLYYSLSSPPGCYTIEDDWWSTDLLDPGETETHTFYNITSYYAGTWHMYGLADCDSNVTESNENNNYKGPVNVNWIQPPPDLIVQSLVPTNYYPPITEHVNVNLTIKNQSSYPVLDSFYTDFYKNRTSTPPIPSTGEEFCYWKSGPLSTWETKTFTFYKLPTNPGPVTGSWRMWGVVDSRPNSWGNIQESNENNNRLSEYLYWSTPPDPHSVTRDQIMQHAQDYDNVAWYCYPWYTYPVSQCPDWSSDYTPYQWYYGEAYCWGGWDKWQDFSDYLYYGLLRPGSHDENDCITGGGDPYWATGTDCSGLVSRCWELGQKHNCSMLASATISTQIPANSLLSGDILNKTSAPAHVMLFHQWIDAGCETLLVYEARSYGVGRDSNVVDINRYLKQNLLAQGYVPRRFNYVEEPGQHNPEIAGPMHCKYPQQDCNECIKFGQEFTLEITATDQDGDSMYYEWLTYYGWFIVNGQFVYACTTAENYVTYLAPGSPFSEDCLYITVRDDRGGWASITGSLGVYPQGTSCLCGDATGNSIIDAGDLVFLHNYLFAGGPPPDPLETGDVNNNCVVDAGDIIYLLNYLFVQGPPPECCWIH
jgi:subtilisin-like proprotein convertase family protein